MKLDIKLSRPVRDLYPREWLDYLNTDNLDNAEFRNLQHFKHYVSKITQRRDSTCGVTYAKALSDLVKETPLYDEQEYESVRDLVRSKLLKRGLTTEDIYESYKYAHEGVVVDIAKIVEEDPMCFLTPVKSYTNHFYELYVNVSYQGSVSNEHVQKNCIKLLATIEELERQHIYIKVTIVDVSKNVSGNKSLLCILPLFSHKEAKSIRTMSSVINDRLLRKFMFAMSEDIYGDELASGYGGAVQLPQTINLGYDVNEIELFTSIYDQVITPGTR